MSHLNLPRFHVSLKATIFVFIRKNYIFIKIEKMSAFRYDYASIVDAT